MFLLEFIADIYSFVLFGHYMYLSFSMHLLISFLSILL